MMMMTALSTRQGGLPDLLQHVAPIIQLKSLSQLEQKIKK